MQREVRGQDTGENREAVGAAWLSRRTAGVLMVLLTVAVFALVWFSAPPGADWRASLKIALVMAAAMWLVFLFVFTLSRWLHSR